LNRSAKTVFCNDESGSGPTKAGKKQLLNNHENWQTDTAGPVPGTSRICPSLTTMPGFANSRPVLLRAAIAAVFGVVGAAGAAELPLLVLPNEGTSGALDSADTRVLPVWSSESGRVEALLLLDSRESGLNPLDRLLGGDTVAPGLGARLSLADGSRVSTALQFDPDAGLALLCNGSIGIGGLARHVRAGLPAGLARRQ
jgi:hypothetical protein